MVEHPQRSRIRPEDANDESPGQDHVEGTEVARETNDPPKEDEFLWKWKVCTSIASGERNSVLTTGGSSARA
jgi:hypothetical protein